VNVAAHFAQMLKFFARIMVNFSSLGMQHHWGSASPASPCHTLMIVAFAGVKGCSWNRLYESFQTLTLLALARGPLWCGTHFDKIGAIAIKLALVVKRLTCSFPLVTCTLMLAVGLLRPGWQLS